MKHWKNIKKSVSCLLFALPLVAGGAAHAEFTRVSLTNEIPQQRKVDLKYDVYAGGFKALNATLAMDVDAKAYDMALKAETEGFIGDMFPWKASYTTSGHADKNGTPVPVQHLAKSSWKKSTKVTEMDYDPNGTLLKTTTQEGSKTTVNRDIDPAMSDDTVDMLTGTLMMLQNAKNTQKCEGTFPVFDGKRRFNITMQDDGTDTILKNKYSSFDGEAIRCTLKIEPVAGFKKKDQKRGWLAVQNHTEERKKPPTLWLAKIDGTGPMVPVKMEIASAYGAVVAHLTGTK
jgi:hypothetical protein